MMQRRGQTHLPIFKRIELVYCYLCFAKVVVRMSNNYSKKNNQKQRKKMDPAKKAKILLGFKTLVSNGAVMEAGRTFKWWFPVVMALFAAILAVIPTFVSNINIQAGNSFLSTTYGYELGLLHFEQKLDAQEVSLVIEDGKLKNTTNNWNEKMSASDAENWYKVKATDLYGEGTTATIFEVFYNNTDRTDEAFLKAVQQNLNPYVTATDEFRSFDSLGNPLSAPIIPYLVLGKESFYAASFKATGAAAGAVMGLYDHHNGLDLRSLATKNINGDPLTGDALVGRGKTQAIIASWKEFINAGYQSTKIRNTWTWTGIIVAVNVGTIALMGLLIFLLTRGKRNPFRVITFWEAFKMSMLASFSPAVISIPLGFLMTQFAYFGFVIVLAFRIMWMSMRTLSPTTAQQ